MSKFAALAFILAAVIIISAFAFADSGDASLKAGIRNITTQAAQAMEVDL